jgi:6,7-dimethyl-8-ribityllumazine synthase
MATQLRNLSDYDHDSVPFAKGLKIGLVVAEWNLHITKKLADGACSTLIDQGIEKEDIVIKYVPGSFEITLGAQLLNEQKRLDAIICIGCVIKGETPHFDYICQSVTYGITKLNLKLNMPIVFGVLTTNNEQQAKDRAGGKHGNKGTEAAITAIKMATFQRH